MRLLIFAIVFFSFISCGKEGTIIPKTQIIQKIEPAEEEQFSYEFRGNNCTTGEHAFSTHAKACQALLNDELNNDCAHDRRVQLYENEQCSA